MFKKLLNVKCLIFLTATLTVQLKENEGLQENLKKIEKTGFVIRFDTFGVFKSGLDEFLSPSAASFILYMSAKKCGGHECKRITGEIKAKENALAYLSYLKKSMNWGKISFRDVDFKRGTRRITVSDSFETAARKSTEACCHFLRGFFAGFLSELFAREVTVVEEECAGKGDAHCEFEFS